MFAPAGPNLTEEEKRFFGESNPFGFILFTRNCETPDQLEQLVTALRSAVNDPAIPILIDQEGGRVQRLRQPHWQEYPAAGTIANLAIRDPEAAIRAAWLHAHLIGLQLFENGINVNCAPCLDLAFEGASEVIGDRSYGADAEQVSQLGQAACEGYLAAGIMPVIKHMPGHGRADVDSHLDLPTITADRDALRQADFIPFQRITAPVWGMTAHIVVTAFGLDQPVTHSSAGITDLIRGEIGFDGLLFSDDLSMQALEGSLAERAAGSIKAGCDIALHCNGDMSEMREIAEVIGPLSAEGWARAKDRPIPAKPDLPSPDEFRGLRQELAELLA